MRDRGEIPDQWLPLFTSAGIAVSYRALAEQAGIDHTRARRVLLGAGTTETAVAAVARAFDVAPGQVWELRGEPAYAPFTLPSRAGQLNRREREVVLGVVDAILQAKNAVDAERPLRAARKPAGPYRKGVSAQGDAAGEESQDPAD